MVPFRFVVSGASCSVVVAARVGGEKWDRPFRVPSRERAGQDAARLVGHTVEGRVLVLVVVVEPVPAPVVGLVTVARVRPPVDETRGVVAATPGHKVQAVAGVVPARVALAVRGPTETGGRRRAGVDNVIVVPAVVVPGVVVARQATLAQTGGDGAP